MQKNPYTAPELLPQQVLSDQVKSLLDVFADIIEQLTEKSEKKIDVTFETEKDRNGFL